MEIVYPLTWARPHREAMRDQSVNTAAALARQGIAVTLLMPRGPDDPALTPSDLRGYYGVSGDFAVVQRPSRWSGQSLFRTVGWLRQVIGDPLLAGNAILYSRIPAMLGLCGLAPGPFALEQFRLWPDEYPWLRPFFRRTASDRNCLGLVLHSRHAAQGYTRAGVGADRLLIAHNGVDPGRLGAPLEKAAARELLGLPLDRPVVVYSGRIGEDKGLDQVGRLARLRPEVLFLLVGYQGTAQERHAAPGAENVRLVPWQTPGKLGAWLWAADVLLVPPASAPLERFGTCVLPIKLFTYLAAGRPILAPDAPDVRELLTHEQTALLVEPDRPELAAIALDRLLGDRPLAATLAESARERAKGLSWDARAAKIATFLRERLAQVRPV